MYTRYTWFIAYVCVCIDTYRTDRTWDTYRYITLTIYLAIKRNRAGLLLAELCASTLYLQNSPVHRALIICRRHMSRVRTAPRKLVEPILVYRWRRLDWEIELCVGKRVKTSGSRRNAISTILYCWGMYLTNTISWLSLKFFFDAFMYSI